MIHVEVGPAPDEFLNSSLRKREVEALRAWLGKLADVLLPAPALAGRYYSVPGLLGKLEAAFAHKCAFCESAIAPGEGAIMFYRPVGSPGGKVDAKSYYYPWLAWDWSNFYLACQDCVLVREAGFKVVQKAVPDVSHLDRENVVFYAAVEEPSLLNPRIEAPVAFLQFSENGEIGARNGAERGQYTIGSLKLNRPALVQKRKEEAQKFKQLWLAAGTAWTADPNSAAPDVVDLTTTLTAQYRSSKPFAGLKAYLLMEWLLGEELVARRSNNPFAAAREREPWLQVYQAAMETLGIQESTDSPVRVSDERSTPTVQGQSAVGVAQASTIQVINIQGDMYQIGSISGGSIIVGRGDRLPEEE